MKIEIITATRASLGEFWSRSALGQSLRRLSADPPLAMHVAHQNTRRLPAVYNDCIAAAAADSILVFMHDDVWIDDCFIAQRLIEALSAFEIVGVAGNRRRVSRQLSWAFPAKYLTWDQPEFLSGGIGHGPGPLGRMSFFGEVPAACELLDGVFLAARRSTLVGAGVGFDTRFAFHFYDLDFCRSARAKGLTLGTWPIALTHQSVGSFTTPAWEEGYRVYLDKWGD